MWSQNFLRKHKNIVDEYQSASSRKRAIDGGSKFVNDFSEKSWHNIDNVAAAPGQSLRAALRSPIEARQLSKYVGLVGLA